MDLLQNSQMTAMRSAGDIRLVAFGHITQYLPKLHAVQVLIPQYCDPELGLTYETGPIQLGTIAAGNGFGYAYAPFGGATLQNPEAGEECAILIIQRNDGVMLCANLLYNDKMQSPGSGLVQASNYLTDDELHGMTSDPDGLMQLQPGESLIRVKPGSFLKWYADGSVQLFSYTDLNLYTKGNLNATVREGDATIDVQIGNLVATVAGDVAIDADGAVGISSTTGLVSVAGAIVDITSDTVLNLSAPAINAGSAVQALCNEIFLERFNGHVHPNDTGTTGTPTAPGIPGVDTTTVFQAA
jgi:hypothetical protein